MVSEKSVRIHGEVDENSLSFDSLIEGFHGGIFILDDNFRVVYLNDELLRMFGGQRNDVLGQDFRNFLQDDFKEVAEKRYLGRQKGESVPVKYELSVINKHGEIRNVEISASTYENADGKRETICHLIDLTDKKRAVNDLVDSERRLKTIFEHAPDAYYITDRTGKFLDGNKAAVDIISSPGVGTTFRIFWPALDQKISQSDTVTKHIKINSRSKTILVVEDDDHLRSFLNSVFSSLGYLVLTACNGEEAQKLAADHPQQIQLLFSDIIMPDINGRDLAIQFRSVNPEIKVLLTSGYTNDPLIHKDEDFNGFDFIQKPFSARVLGEKVRQLLDA